MIGPFAGTILDRFHRRSVVMFANLIRSLLLVTIAALIFTESSQATLIPVVLLSFGLSRLLLAGLSAGLPRVVDVSFLVPANAIAVTGGTVVAVIGGGIGFGIRGLTQTWSSAVSDAVIVSTASLVYFVAALSALLLRRDELGPDEHERVRARGASILLLGWIDVRDGLRHLLRHVRAGQAIARIALVRGGMTALIVTTILLQRNAFNTDADEAITDLAVVITAIGVGALVGATITPRAVLRWGRRPWMHLNTVFAAIFAILFALIQTPLSVPLLMLAFSAAAQAIKVSADAEVQLAIDDGYRGRVFAVYDMGVNVAIVMGALTAAILLPANGRSALVPLLVATMLMLSLTAYASRAAHQSRRS